MLMFHVSALTMAAKAYPLLNEFIVAVNLFLNNKGYGHTINIVM